ncbi:hypothetical protein GGTG_01584 [Gaeumannomyces tritici R3-111a-1]|uniref:Uncharacterized protein n=1 Tax=Gaeumannomyces tritici (strain R3-111a-1) TaxID=644352 RepID=J3NK02_GAET3|nr:hypothetical protein GGTG_01584 [Gaeumannomyces tritici R3-111a-1]EJT81606.1 hypothetical protein GGTG_01584 [Gaeumannomyces tritici R3-111a-1]
MSSGWVPTWLSLLSFWGPYAGNGEVILVGVRYCTSTPPRSLYCDRLPGYSCPLSHQSSSWS